MVSKLFTSISCLEIGLYKILRVTWTLFYTTIIGFILLLMYNLFNDAV